MIMKRAMYTAGAVASAALITLTQSGSAFAAGYGHAWNNSPSTNECLATSANTLGNPAIMWTCDSEAGQQWEAYEVASNPARDEIRNELGGCLDSMGSKAGAAIYVLACNGGSNQQWVPVPSAGGSDEWLNATTGKAVSVSGGSTANGANVISWTPQQTADQQWGGTIGGY